MKVSDLLQQSGHDPVVCLAQERVQVAARRMFEHNIGALPVLDEGRLVGILSERDISRAVGERGDISGLHVSDLMTPKVATCRPEDPIQGALELMHQRHIRHLPVLDAARRLVGVISQRDLFDVLLAETKDEAHAFLDSLVLDRLRSMKSAGGPPGES